MGFTRAVFTLAARMKTNPMLPDPTVPMNAKQSRPPVSGDGGTARRPGARCGRSRDFAAWRGGSGLAAHWLSLGGILGPLLAALAADANRAPGTYSPPLPAPPAPVVDSPRPAPDLTVTRTGPGEYRLGPVRLNKQADTVQIPVAINGQALNAPLEYLLVTEAGKVHESLLVTSTSATQIRLAMLLLGWRGSNEPVTLSLGWPAAAAAASPSPETLVHAGGQPTRKLDPAWGVQAIAGADNGSTETVGQIISLIEDSSALIGYRGWGATNEVLWRADTNGIPAAGGELSLTIRRQSGASKEGAK